MEKLKRFRGRTFGQLFAWMSHLKGMTYTVEFSEEKFENKICAQNKVISVGLLELFLISGILNSPKKKSIAGLGTILQHAEDFSLKSPSWIESRFHIKSEHKTKLTENLATGLCGIFLFQEYGVISIEDVQPLLSNGSLEFSSKKKKSRPDFLCLDSKKEAFLVECKGRDGQYPTSVLTKAKSQLTNVSSGSTRLRNSCQLITCSSKFDYGPSSSLGKILFVDPDSSPIKINISPKALLIADLNRTLDFFQLPSFDFIVSKIKKDERRFPKVDIAGTQFYNLDDFYFNDWLDILPIYLHRRNEPIFKLNTEIVNYFQNDFEDMIPNQLYRCSGNGKDNEKDFFSLSLPNGFSFSL